MLQVQCPKCTQALQVPETAAGKVIRCPKCNQTMALPAAPAPVKPVQPPPVKPAAPTPVQAAPPPVKPSPPPPRPAPVVKDPPIEIIEEEPPVLIPSDEPTAGDGLGPLIKEYKPRNWWIGFVIFTVLMLLNVPFTALAIGSDNKAWIAPAMVPQLLFLLGSFGCGMFALLALKQRVLLYERGLFADGLFSSNECSWTDVVSVIVVRSGFPATTDLYIQEAENEKAWGVSSMLRGIDELAEHVQTATAPFIRARIKQKLDRGADVSFGDFITVTPKKLVFRPKGKGAHELMLRWKDIELIDVGRYQVRPGAGGIAGAVLQMEMRVVGPEPPAWFCPTGNIANFALFLEVVEKRFGVKVSRL